MEEEKKEEAVPKAELKGNNEVSAPATENKAKEGAKTISPAKKNNCCLAAIIVFITLLVVTIATFVLLFFKGKDWIESKLHQTDTETTSSTTGTSSSKFSETNLVGHWDTGCLVPDPESPWAERHEFIINANGTATHWRYSGDSCAGIVKEDPQNYTLTIPATGQINFTDTGGAGTFYDIYKVSGSTLEFGHGFRDKYPTAMTFGGSDGQRFNSLNTFLAYKKV